MTLKTLQEEKQHGKLVGMRFDKVTAVYSNDGSRSLISTGEEPVYFECGGSAAAKNSIDAEMGI